MGGGGAAAAGLLLILQGQLRRLIEVGAVSYETRKSAKEIGLNENQLRTLVSMKWAQVSDDGKYYAIIRVKRR